MGGVVFWSWWKLAVSVGVSIPYYFYKNHTFDNRLGGLKFPNAVANNFLDDWVMKKQAKESHFVWW